MYLGHRWEKPRHQNQSEKEITIVIMHLFDYCKHIVAVTHMISGVYSIDSPSPKSRKISVINASMHTCCVVALKYYFCDCLHVA